MDTAGVKGKREGDGMKGNKEGGTRDDLEEEDGMRGMENERMRGRN